MDVRGRNKEVELMGYVLEMRGAKVEGEQRMEFGFRIGAHQAQKENVFLPSMVVENIDGIFGTNNRYKVQIETVAYGNQGIEQYKKFMEATQKAFFVAEEFQKEIDKFMMDEVEYWIG